MTTLAFFEKKKLSQIKKMTTPPTAKNWCFTLNNYTEDEVEFLSKCTLKPDYFIRFIAFSHELGTIEDTPHLQGYLSCKHAVRLTQLKKVMPRAHLEPMRGRLDQNAKYCSKQGELHKFGDEPVPPGPREQNRWLETMNHLRNGDLESIDPDIRIRYYGNLNKLLRDYSAKPLTIDGLFENEWIWGPPGSGKSKRAREENPDLYVKSLNKWWDQYNGEHTILIDDFQPGFHMEYFIKIWADRYPFRAESKGGSLLIRPRKIVVTSNFSIEQCFNGVDCEAVKRRFIEIHLR